MGRPLLLAARLPESVAGCRIDGIDIETWTHERLLDIIVLGCRSFEGGRRSLSTIHLWHTH